MPRASLFVDALVGRGRSAFWWAEGDLANASPLETHHRGQAFAGRPAGSSPARPSLPPHAHAHAHGRCWASDKQERPLFSQAEKALAGLVLGLAEEEDTIQPYDHLTPIERRQRSRRDSRQSSPRSRGRSGSSIDFIASDIKQTRKLSAQQLEPQGAATVQGPEYVYAAEEAKPATAAADYVYTSDVPKLPVAASRTGSAGSLFGGAPDAGYAGLCVPVARPAEGREAVYIQVLEEGEGTLAASKTVQTSEV